MQNKAEWNNEEGNNERLPKNPSPNDLDGLPVKVLRNLSHAAIMLISFLFWGKTVSCLKTDAQ